MAREHRCRRGDARACYLAGINYQWGQGAARDYQRAAERYRQACETRSPPKGIAKACTNLGYLYAHGQGLKRDVARAIHYYGRGCDGGNAQGCNNLGVLYDHGKHGVTRDYARAKTLFDRACNAKLALACSNLGLLYRKGHGVKTDRRRAQQLFVTACGGGSSAGCYHAGWGELRGHGGRRDWRAAQRRFALGCSLARRKMDRGSCRVQARMRFLDRSLGVTTGLGCEHRGLWRPQSGRLVALADAKASRLASVTFASLRWAPDLMARVIIPRRAGAHPRVALDDGRIGLRALVIPARSGSAPRFYLAKQKQVSPVLWLAPGLRLRLRGHGSGGGVLATVQPSALTPLGRRKRLFPLSCDELSLHRVAWTRPANWPAGGPALGNRALVRSGDVPLAAKPRGRAWERVRKPGPSRHRGVLGILRTRGKGVGPRPGSTKKKRPPTLTVELLAKRGLWRRIRYAGYRFGVVAWVLRTHLRPVAPGGVAGLLGGLGLSGRGQRGPKARFWRCRSEVVLSASRPGGTPRQIGVLHPQTRFTVLARKAALVTIHIPGLRWLQLHPKARFVISAQALHRACKQG